MTKRVVLVTGAASGLGAAIAKRLAADGCVVAIADIDVEGGAKVVAEIEGDGGTASLVECDVTNREAITSAAREIAQRHDGVDGLINNAGIENPGFFLSTDPASWETLVRVNLFGVLNCTYVVAPLIFERSQDSGYGRIVNIASEAARSGALGESVYSATKGGVVAFSKSMAREFARFNVTVNAVCPGPVDTPMTEAIGATEIGAKLMDRIKRATPLRRFATPDDVSSLVGYLMNPDASLVTGQVISVSGGLTMNG